MKNLSLGKKINKLRLQRSWSQAQLAEICNLSLRTIQRLEKSGKCSHETLLAIAAAFDLDISDLKSPEYFIYGSNTFLAKVNHHKLAFWGIILAAPALYFILANILKYNFNINLLAEPLQYIYSDPQIFYIFNQASPILFLGGLCLALLLNVLPFIDFRFEKYRSELHGHFTLRFFKTNLYIGLGSLGCLLLLFSYFVAESLI